MKAKYLRQAARCNCGGIFLKQDQVGAWYWCSFCDAHVTDCKAKGRVGDCPCRWTGRGKAA